MLGFTKENFAVLQKTPLGSILQLKQFDDPDEVNVNETKKIVERGKAVVSSWDSSFSFKKEEQNKRGLRSPQMGALHAIHSYWTVSNKPATIVMPTGTGKTEVMISILISGKCKKVLVIVPTNALRKQLAVKFLTLGILKEFGIVSENAKQPIVGILEHRTDDMDLLKTFISKCNVMVTTMSIAAHLNKDTQSLLAESFTHLFIDEAHHIPAKTWNKFRVTFVQKRKKILQFTATPFRNDDRHIDGEIIYRYPLRLAQENEYFKKINFRPIREFDPELIDEKLAELGIEQLQNDPESHILMARVNTKKRAEEIFKIYENYTQYNPVMIHSGLSDKKQEEIRNKIINKQTRVIICVDMLGEGFDLPELKIAVFHDIKKSLAVTLQLAGRFTRSRDDLGDATFVANIADTDVREELHKLYQQDADWNVLLEEGAEKAVLEQIGLRDFVKDFQNLPEEIPLQNLKPAISTVIYKVSSENWSPENFEKGIKNINSYDKVLSDINQKTNTLVVITAKRSRIDWVRQEGFFEWNWESYIVFFDKIRRLIFVHSSSNRGYFKNLVSAITEGNIELVKGTDVFRSLHGLNRLMLYNVGLRRQIGRLIRYRMHAGSDVGEGLTEVAKRNTTKSNIFGVGYENGKKVSMGCSYKGRLWSHRVGSIKHLYDWCISTGQKILDESINPDDVLKGTLTPEIIDNLPNKIPVLAEWPDNVFGEIHGYYLVINNTEIPLIETELLPKEKEGNKKLKLIILHNNDSFSIELEFFKNNNESDYKFVDSSGRNIKIKKGGVEYSLGDFFYDNPPLIFYADGALLEGNSYIKLKHEVEAYSVDDIQTWDWSDINIRKESIGLEHEMNSVQGKLITELQTEDWSVIFNDDGSGEIADVVALRFDDEKVYINLYHCKFSSEDNPGGRIKDLYEVCGQAQKSVKWVESLPLLFLKLFKRNAKSMRSNFSRFEKGDESLLSQIEEMSVFKQVESQIFIVQPGLSKKDISDAQKRLLAVTRGYLMETLQIPFNVIAND